MFAHVSLLSMRALRFSQKCYCSAELQYSGDISLPTFLPANSPLFSVVFFAPCTGSVKSTVDLLLCKLSVDDTEDKT